jgi:hypothetical protein
MKDKLIDKLISFDKLLGITAITLALVAAFFSVYGIATLFAGAFVLTAIMASTLEVGKLVTVTFLYRYWQKSKSFLKIYLCVAAFVLMLITSIGIFGYLSAAYQKSALEFKASQEKIILIEGQKTYLHDKIEQSKARIKTLNDMRAMQEARLNEGMTNAFLVRNPLQLKQLQEQTIDMVKSADANIKEEQTKIQTTTDEIQGIDTKVNEMKFASAGKKDIRTFQFVAEQFGTTLDNVAKWFIITLIFVFDPLAVALILAYNIAVYKKPVEPVSPEIPKQTPSEPVVEKSLILNTAAENPPVPTEPAAPIPTSEPIPENNNADAEFRRMFKT